MSTLQDKLKISEARLAEVNALLTGDNATITAVVELVERFGGPEAINQKATDARKLDNLMARLRKEQSPYVKDLEWLTAQRDAGAFVSVADYRAKTLGDKLASTTFDEDNAVTLEISALQYFPMLIAEAKQAIEKQELMPGRYIRVRNMAEQAQDKGDILAVAAAMQILGASYVETLDTKGTDGSNVHLGGPGTIAGSFGGVGQPNGHAVKWADEFLRHYIEYGIRQVLNINPGTVLVGYLLHKLGVDIEFKISVFMGNDNPFSVLWTLLGARLFARDDGTTSLIGFNFANSVDNDTIRAASAIRKQLGLQDVVRFEHHITETYKSIVIQPYDRLEELVEVAKEVPNISAKHEGGVPEVDGAREHPSDILDYFMPKADVEAQGLMAAFERNYLDKHDSVNRTAAALTRAGLATVSAPNLHK
jgi:hypothetical protein